MVKNEGIWACEVANTWTLGLVELLTAELSGVVQLVVGVTWILPMDRGVLVLALVSSSSSVTSVKLVKGAWLVRGTSALNPSKLVQWSCW